MSLSAVIVDDEQLARDELAFLLKHVGDACGHAGVAENSSRQDTAEGGGAFVSGGSKGYLLRLDRGRGDFGGHRRRRWSGRPIQLPDVRGTAGFARFQPILAGPPFLPGQYQTYSGSRPLVQEFLPVAHG